MNDKIAKEIAKELRMIRIELQKLNAPKIMSDETEATMDLKEKLRDLPGVISEVKAGERVTIR